MKGGKFLDTERLLVLKEEDSSMEVVGAKRKYTEKYGETALKWLMEGTPGGLLRTR
jgi:hypothetical protein